MIFAAAAARLQHPSAIWFWESPFISCVPPSVTSSPFSHRPRRGSAVSRGKAVFVCIFAHILCIYVCVCVWTAIVCQCSSRGFKVNYSCEIWIHANGSLPSPGTDPGNLWQRRLQEASLHPSSSSSSSFSSCFSQAPTPRTMLSTQWYCFDCCNTRLGGCTLWGGRISHNSQSRSEWEMEEWRVDRLKEGWKILPSSCSDGKLRRRHSAAGGGEVFRWRMMLSPMRRSGHTLTCYSDSVAAHAH